MFPCIGRSNPPACFRRPILPGRCSIPRTIRSGLFIGARSILLAALLCIPITVSSASAEDGRSGNTADTLFWAPEIIVEAKRIRPDDKLFNQSGFVASINLEKRRDRMEDVASVLSKAVGVRVKQYGGLGSFATLSIRGSSSSQVQVYMDGVPLNDAYTGMTNLADLALGDLRRIEVFRGFSPARFGSSSIGGTVNLVTIGSEDWESRGAAPDIEALVSAGSFDTRKLFTTLVSRLGRVRLHGHLGYTGSDGDYSFHDDNATPENPTDDETAERLNNDFSRLNLTGRLVANAPRFKFFSVNYDMTIRGGGVPGLGSNQSTTARFERERRLTYAKLKPDPVLSRRIHTEATAYYSWTAERFDDPLGEINITRQKSDNRIKTHGFSVRSKLYPPRVPMSIDVFFEGKKDRFHPVSYLPKTVAGPDRLRDTKTVAVSGDLWLFGERLVLTAGSRNEWHENEFYNESILPWIPPTPQGKTSGREQTPSFGFRFHPASFLAVKGNWGRHYRLATFFELFGNLGSVTGDSGLENEEGLNRDIGIILFADRLRFLERPFLEVVYLDNEIENLILFFPNSQHTIKPRNIGSASIKGLETTASCSIRNTIVISGNYSYLKGEDTSAIPYYNANDLAGRPAHEASIMIGLSRKNWELDYDLHFIGSNYLDRANRNKVPSREIHSLALTLKLPDRGISLNLEGQNLGDNQISDVNGFPLPGRSFYTTLKVKI